jgi:hypothetical protein
MRKIISFCVASTMLGGGIYLGMYLIGFLFWPSPTVTTPQKLPIFIFVASAFPIFLGGYWLWIDFVAPAFGRIGRTH